MNVSKVITLRKEEKVIRVLRNFWPIHLSRVLLGSFLIVLSFFFMMPLFRLGWPGVAGFFLLTFLGFWYSLRSLFIWYWNVFIVTNQRVVDVNQRGFFSREVSEANYEKIQDVLYSVSGLWHALFNCGAVRLQTAASGMALEISDVAAPKAVHHLITETMTLFERVHQRGTPADKVSDLLETVSELSDAEAKAFLVSLQQAVGRGTEVSTQEKKSRREAIKGWTEDKPDNQGGIFKVDIAE